MNKRRILIVVVAAFILLSVFGGFSRPEEKSGTYILSISVSGTGRVVGKNIECSAVCNISLPAGTEAVLTAFPTREWSFSGWDGACTENDGCTVLMDGNKSVQAIFTYP